MEHAAAGGGAGARRSPSSPPSTTSSNNVGLENEKQTNKRHREKTALESPLGMVNTASADG